MMELRELKPEEIASAYKYDMYDRKIIDQYWNYFSQTAQQAVGEVVRQSYDLPEAKVPGMPDVDGGFGQLFNPALADTFWDTWLNRGLDSLRTLRKEWEAFGFGATEKKKPGKEGLELFPAKIDLGAKIDKIEVHLPEDSLERMAEETGRQVTEKLKTDEDLAKTLAKIIRPYV